MRTLLLVRRIDLALLFRFFFGLAIFLLPLRLTSLVYTGESYQAGFFDTYAAFFLHISILSFLVSFVFLSLRFCREQDFQPPNRVLSRYVFWLLLLLLTSAVMLPFAREAFLSLLNFWQLLVLVFVALILGYGIFPRTLLVQILAVAFALQAVLALGQFLAGGDLRLHWLGESYFDANTFNVAKISLSNGLVVLRGMGTLPHANIFGGLSALVLLLLAVQPRKNIYLYLAAVLILIGLFFSFSRAAYLAFFFGLALLTFFQFRRRIFSTLVGVAIFGLLIWFFGGLFFTRFGEWNTTDASRIVQLERAGAIFLQHPLGVGSGSFTSVLAENVPQANYWQIQPVHNFFALKLVEESWLVVSVWLVLFGTLFYFAYNRRRYEALALLAAVFILAQFDHYFATNFSAQALLFCVLGFVIRELNTPKESGA